jgi:hypothetical protein
MPTLPCSIRVTAGVLAAALCVTTSAGEITVPAQGPSAAAPLPGTAPLEWPEEDLSDRMMDGAHRFVERQIADVQARSARFWKPDASSAAAPNASLAGNRERLREIIGAVDARLRPVVERFGDDENPALVAETSRYRVYQVRWPVLDGVSAEGLLVEPVGGAPGARIDRKSVV